MKVEKKTLTTMWGVCIDIKQYRAGVYQQVVLYEMWEDGSALILMPERAAGILCFKGEEEILALPAPPKYIYGQRVFPVNHPERQGIVLKIGWHFKRNCCFYKIKIGKKIKSRRYFENELISGEGAGKTGIDETGEYFAETI